MKQLRTLTIITILALLTGCTALAGGQPVPRFEPGECPFSMPYSPSLRRDVDCGYLVVLENRAEPTGRTIRLPVAIFHPPGGAVHPDPIIYLSGGPGMSVLRALDINDQAFDQGFASFFKTGRDLILFDQRGVGFSEPALYCEAYQETAIDLLDRKIGDGPLLTSAAIIQTSLAGLAACADELERKADLQMYHSSTNAEDVADLRTVLGYEHVNLVGGSYGTRLALTVMRDHPEGIRSVILDAAYPLEADLYLSAAANAHRAFDHLFTTCAADPDCAAAYPDLESLFYTTVGQLNEKPARLALTDLLSGDRYPALLDGNIFLSLIFFLLYDTNALPVLPQIILETSESNYDSVKLVRSATLIQGEVISQGMMFSVQCHDEIPFSSEADHLASLTDHSEIAGAFGGERTGGTIYNLCANWDSGTAGSLENQAVTSPIPTLVLAGEFDPVTPPAWGAQAAENLPNSYFFSFPGMGHGVSTADPCPEGIVGQFISQPNTRPNDQCIAQMTFTFEIPTALDTLQFESADIPSASAVAALPVGWKETTPGYFTSPEGLYEIKITDQREEDLGRFLETWGAEETPLQEYSVSGQVWTIYKFQRLDLYPRGYLAIAPHTAGFHAVFVMSSPDTYQPMLAKVLLPVLDAFQPNPPNPD